MNDLFMLDLDCAPNARANWVMSRPARQALDAEAFYIDHAQPTTAATNCRQRALLRKEPAIGARPLRPS